MKVQINDLIKTTLILLLISGMNMKRSKSLRHHSQNDNDYKVLDDLLETVRDHFQNHRLRITTEEATKLQEENKKLKDLISNEKSTKEEVKKELENILRLLKII